MTHMPDLTFQIEGVSVPAHAALPALDFVLRIRNAPAEEEIQSVLLHCQVRLEVTRRSYSRLEQEKLKDLFGPPEQWSRSLHSLYWTNATTVVVGFSGATLVDLILPCSFDFNVAATKYFGAQLEGEIPLLFLFSGTVFYRTGTGLLQAAQISWQRENEYRLPVHVWREMMDRFYPDGVWLCLRRDVFDRFYAYKVDRGMTNWEAALESLLPPDDGRLALTRVSRL